MSKVEKIEQEIESLSTQELAQLRRWFRDFDAQAWDRQIEEDARTGKFDRLAEEAISSYQAGKAREI